MIPLEYRSKPDSPLRKWSQLVCEHASAAVNLTVGFMSGSRLDIDRRAVDRLTGAATTDLGLPTLLIRLSVCGAAIYVPHAGTSTMVDDRPTPRVSPLGSWSEVSLDMPLGGSAPRVLELLPKWLVGWKKEYRLILIDLGPMHQAPCRTMGRYCDACYLVLGPYSCASHAWIMQQIALQSRSGVLLAGTIVAEAHDWMAA